MKRTSTKNVTRKMTFEEIFENRIEYYKSNTEKFTEGNLRFLEPIENYKSNIGVTKKQMIAFINTVDSVYRKNVYKYL